MQASSDAFALEILDGAKMATRVSVYKGSQLMEDTFYGGDSLVLLSENSSVTYDRLSDTRTTGDLSFIVQKDSAIDLIDPVAFPEVVVYSGIDFGSTIEWIEMGTMGVFDINLERTGRTVYARCQVADRSTRIRDNSWKAPFQIALGLDYYVAMMNVVTDRARGFTPAYNISSNVLTTPAMTFSESDDPWAAVLKLAEAVGAEAYFDRQGAFAAFAVPDPALVAPSLNLFPDSQGPLITPVSRGFGNRDVFNGVICRGEAPWLLFPVSGEVWDDDPTSPSYRLGPFGEKPKTIGDALATTDAQCLAAAQAEYRKISGVVEMINFNTVKDPRLEVGDIIHQIDDDLLISGRYVLDTYRYPLGSGAASGTVRRKR